MTSSEDVLCPDTGTPMKQSGTARRIIREPDKTYYIWIPVYYSVYADRYHRVLPDFVIPFKHYISNVIKASEENHPDLDYYDLPSDSSRIRWHSWLTALDPSSLLVSYINDFTQPYRYHFLWPLNSKRL